MQVDVLDHPLAAVALTTLRDADTSNASFRRVLSRLTTYLLYEALRTAPVDEIVVHTPVGVARGARLTRPPLLVPVLRAGLGMVEQASVVLPESRVGFIGVARDEQTHQPEPYLASLPDELADQPVFLLDPMLATGGSLLHALELLVSRGADTMTAVCVVAAPEGVTALEESGYPVRLVTAAIDERLNEDAFIVPGLGDAGDRQFGPR